ncbi:hypothetical protein SETIT_1G327800v2 [Setaria italica]|uniref:Cyanobacterial aminoacyl-tRNA synthetase CAAD domain-containing protein n=1 Tax=Setaria italica TaxID=4555 RepID=A0A368PS52_SETIT|nr:hypothetical protein SETIT_1G327800v2 [Setaria italica]
MQATQNLHVTRSKRGAKTKAPPAHLSSNQSSHEESGPRDHSTGPARRGAISHEPSHVTEAAERAGRRSSASSDTGARGRTRHSSTAAGSHQPSITSHPPRGSQKPQNPPGRPPRKEERRGKPKRRGERAWRSASPPPPPPAPPPRPSAAARVPSPPSRSAAASQLEVSASYPPTLSLCTSRSLSYSLSHSAVFFFAAGWRCATAAVPDPVPSEEPASASSTVVVTDKPIHCDDKVEEAPVAAEVVSSEPSPSPDDGGLDEILSKLNIEVTPTLILTGSGAFVILWVLSSIVSAIDSVPLLPKILELVGTGYSIWFIARYLLFKVHLNSQSPYETTLDCTLLCAQ